eukprot:430970-Pyramimonas_sp.AAC.1
MREERSQVGAFGMRGLGGKSHAGSAQSSRGRAWNEGPGIRCRAGRVPSSSGHAWKRGPGIRCHAGIVPSSSGHAYESMRVVQELSAMRDVHLPGAGTMEVTSASRGDARSSLLPRRGSHTRLQAPYQTDVDTFFHASNLNKARWGTACIQHP